MRHGLVSSCMEGTNLCLVLPEIGDMQIQMLLTLSDLYLGHALPFRCWSVSHCLHMATRLASDKVFSVPICD